MLVKVGPGSISTTCAISMLGNDRKMLIYFHVSSNKFTTTYLNSLWPSDAIRHHIDLGHYWFRWKIFFPGGTKLLPGPLLMTGHWGLVAFTWWQLRKKWSRNLSYWCRFHNYWFMINAASPRGQCVNSTYECQLPDEIRSFTRSTDIWDR